MFADDTNLFYEYNNLKTLFSLVNQELQKNNEWFEANKLSLTVEKIKYCLFHKPSRRDDLPLLLSKKLTTDSILFVYSHLFKLCKFIVGQHKQNKSKKATQSTKACSTNHQQ